TSGLRHRGVNAFEEGDQSTAMGRDGSLNPMYAQEEGSFLMGAANPPMNIQKPQEEARPYLSEEELYDRQKRILAEQIQQSARPHGRVGAVYGQTTPSAEQAAGQYGGMADLQQRAA